MLLPFRSKLCMHREEFNMDGIHTLPKNRFGLNLYRLMETQKVTREMLADKMDVSERTVYYWLNDQRHPGYDQLIKLSQVLSVTIDGLLL